MSFESFINSFVKLAFAVLIALLLYLYAYEAGESIGRFIYYITH